MTCIPADRSHKLVIVGAGPHALALAARLVEDRPAALYTDLEHARLSWLRKEDAATDKRGCKRCTVKGHWSARRLQKPREGLKLSPPNSVETTTTTPIKVFDATSSEWIGKWDRFFSGLNIERLRSPMFFHPSPADNDALIAYARRNGREGELEAIPNVVGAERSKHARKKGPRIGRDAFINERSREDYYRPSTKLFHDFCRDEIIVRYGLEDLVTHATVTSVTYGPVLVEGSSEEKDAFTVVSTAPDGTIDTCVSDAVVFALGPTAQPNVPPMIKEASTPFPSGLQGEGWAHSGMFANPAFKFPPKDLQARIAARLQTTIVVIGGGLTSAQIADLAVTRGVTKVILVCRDKLKVRNFDFGLEWVTKFANLSKMAFWQEDESSERARIVLEARNGGSVTPKFQQTLKRLEKAGDLTCMTHTTLTSATYDSKSQKWSLSLSTLVPNPALDSALVEPRAPTVTELDNVDFVVCSTGGLMAFDQVDCLKPLLQSHPIEIEKGFPRLTRDLQWNKELPAFVMGAYSMLELGPDSPNLAGTRFGAERIAHRLAELEENLTFTPTTYSVSTFADQRVPSSLQSPHPTLLTIMTRSHHLNKETSRHMKPAAKQIKKSGHGSSNWGSFDDEITEGIAIVQNGERAKGSATAAELGMSKLSTSASSTNSGFSDKSSSSSADSVTSDDSA